MMHRSRYKFCSFPLGWTSLVFIIIISVAYALIIMSGYFGWGIDYYVIYFKSDIVSPTIWDYIGWKLATLSIYGNQVGKFITPLIISFCTGLIIRYFFKIQSLNSLLLFITIYLFLLFSWPVIVSSNNAMRQGLLMSFIFLSLIALNDKKIFLSIFFMTIAMFTHKSGISFQLNLIYLLFLIYLNKIIIIKRHFLFLFGIIYLFIFLIIFLSIERYGVRYDHNVVISKDFRILNLLINISYIIYFTARSKLLKNYICLFLYFFSFSALASILAGLNWEYERFNMIMIIPYILAISLCFKQNSKYIYMVTIFVILFILTIQTGMYELGVGIFPPPLK